MKKDIDFPKVEGVHMAIGRQYNETAGEYEYWVYLINDNGFAITNVLVNSSGYSDTQKTSTLRHYREEIAPHSSVAIELINRELFALVNQFWVSYYRDRKVYDKKFLFVAESIVEENFRHVEALGLEAVLHA